MKPGVITFRPDNLLTIGIMVLGMYLAAVGIWQIAGRAGLVKLPASNQVPAGSAVV